MKTAANIFVSFGHNSIFWAAFLGWLIAQFIKVIIQLAQNKKIRRNFLISTGGMPSAHSCSVTALATAVGHYEGTQSTPFAIALVFAILTMMDAATVRRAAGMQAKILNEIIDELFKSHHLAEKKLWELLGHTRVEVFAGMVLGILIGIIVCSLFDMYVL